MNRKMSRQVVRSVAVSACGLAFSGAILADAENKTDQLQEIVVTAEKRASTVQDTPISMTALSGSDLEDRGMTSSGGNSSTVGFYL